MTRLTAAGKTPSILSAIMRRLAFLSFKNSPATLKSQCYPTAIEFGSSSIKLLQLAKTASRGYEICKNAYLPLTQSPPLTPKEYLKKIIDENRLKGEVVSSLPLSKVQVFGYVLPDMPAGEIEAAVVWKLKQNPPEGLSFDNICFDYLSTSSNSRRDSNKEIRVLAFVVPKEIVIDRVKLFREFSLELVAVEPKPYAALNALFWLGKISQEETVLVLQLGATQSSITIVHSGQPYLMRQLAISGNSLTEAIATHNQFDWEKAENIKKQEGLKDWSPNVNENEAASSSICLAALISHMENLVVDIEHTFKYFSHQLMKAQVTSFDRIVLCGGSSALYNLAPFLTDRLGVAVDTFNPLSSLNLPMRQEFNSLAQENSAGFAGVLGLAARYIEW